MTKEDFEGVIAARIEKITKVLFAKNKEYSPGGDKLNNFKEAGRVKNETPEKALWGMMVKQFVACQLRVNDLDSGLVASEEFWDEKIGDVINYFILLECCLAERRGTSA